MIRKVTIENFQKHKYLELEFDEGFNCIAGPSNIGKSAVVRAIAFCLFGRPWSSSWVRENSTYSIVTVEFNDGRKIVRKKGENVNEVVIVHSDGKTDRFTSFGSEYPKEVQDFVGFTLHDLDSLGNLNVSFQLDSPFFLSSPPQARVALLDRLTSLSRLKKALNDVNKEMRDLSVERSHLDKLLAEKESYLSRLSFVEESYHKFLELEQFIHSKLERFKRVDALCQRVIKYKKLKASIQPSLELLERAILSARKAFCLTKLEEQKRKIEHTKNKLEEVEKELAELKKKFERKLIELGVCPLCGSKVNESSSCI